MNRLRATPIVAAALALVATVLLASATPATGQVSSFPVLDDFNRPDEDPLSGGGNWARAQLNTWNPLRLVSNKATNSALGSSMSYWTQETFPGGTGAVWGKWGTINNCGGNRASVLLIKDVGGTSSIDGFEFARESSGGANDPSFHLYRLDNGARTQLASAGDTPNGGYIMLERSGSTVAGLTSQDGQTWTTYLSSTDSNYLTGSYYPAVHLLTCGVTMDDFGAGVGPPLPPPATQSYGTNANGEGVNGGSGTATVAEPVNTRTGAFTTAVDDVATPGTGVAFDWARTYTSADPTIGRLGPGWTDSYSTSLAVQGNGDVLLHGEDGQQLYYTKQLDGSFVGAPGSLSTRASVAGGYELTRTDQVVSTFDSAGKLLSVKDRNNQGLTLAYDGANRLATITDAAGKQVTVGYTGTSTLVSTVSTQDGRSISYGYTSGRLTSVIDVRGKTWTYTYDSGGRLAKIIDPLTHTQVFNVYAASGRVQTQTDATNKTTNFAWDATNEIATVTDANSKVWKHDYNVGVLAKEIDPLNHTTQLGHDDDLNTGSVISPTNEETQMTYDAAGNLLTATAPPSLGSVQKTFVYDGRNDPTQVTDARGKVTSYTYDSSGNTSSVTQDGIQVGSYTYDSGGRPLTSTDGNGKTTTSTYDANGNLASATDPLGNKTTYTYDAAGRVLTRVDPKGNCSGCTPSNYTTTYTYNAAGQVLTETDPLGHVTTHIYDDTGNETSVTDANGHTTTYAYDNANRLLSVTGPDPDGGGPLAAPVTSYTYDPVGNKLTETDPNGHTTSYGYDAANRVSSVTAPDPDGSGPLAAPVTTYAYDANGNLASTVDPRGNVAGCGCAAQYTTSYTYDAAGRLKTTTDPLGDVTTNIYDPVGNLASVKDANNHTTVYTYDAAGRVLTVTAPDGGVTTYTYDGAGNLKSRTDDNNHQTTYAYDDASELASVTLPDPGSGSPVTRYTYDPNRNLLTTVDANGGTTTDGYDSANRLTSIGYSDPTPAVSYAYDNVGNRVTMSDGAGTETRTYDNLDRLLTVARGSNTFSYVYDPAGNVTRRTYPDSTQINYAYDNDNRLISVASGGQTTNYAYDPASELTQTTLPSGNGYLETRTYDRASRLTDVQSKKGASTLAEFAITPDPVGNPTQVVRTGSLAQTQTYTYDASDRLLSVCFQAGTCPGSSDPFIRWSYDKVGNRKTELRPGAAQTTYSYNALDELLSAGSTSYTYDENGNELTGGSSTFTYDMANRLKTATQSGTTTTYAYAGDGVRLQASTGSQASKKTNFLWDVNQGLPQIALERDGNNALIRRYLYGVRRISQTAGSSTSYYVYDGLGSVANLTSSSGATQWTWSYEPFGAIRTQTKANGNQPDNLMKFAGEYLDPTGLYHLRARQLDPATGRLLNPDPLDTPASAPSVSAYAYVGDRPLTQIDPSGMISQPETSSTAAADTANAASSVELYSTAAPCRTAYGSGFRENFGFGGTPEVDPPGRSLLAAGQSGAAASGGVKFGMHVIVSSRKGCERTVMSWTRSVAFDDGVQYLNTRFEILFSSRRFPFTRKVMPRDSKTSIPNVYPNGEEETFKGEDEQFIPLRSWKPTKLTVRISAQGWPNAGASAPALAPAYTLRCPFAVTYTEPTITPVRGGGSGCSASTRG